MVEITGTQISSSSDGDTITSEWRIPALSEGLARRQAKGNMRLKGFSEPEVTEIHMMGEGELPGQGIYKVKVTGSR